MGSIVSGFYAKKQLLSKDKLIAWSHRRRFETGLEILRDLNPQHLLDYGSGDGTFLGMVSNQSWKPRASTGAELDPAVLADCQKRFSGASGINFCLISDLAGGVHQAKFDTVVCMEVLEHVTDLASVLGQIDDVLAPGGRIAISVPVETGLPVFVKQTVRRVAGWRGIGDYKFTSSYTAGELLRSLFAGPAQHIVRPLYKQPDDLTFYDHKGFNWRYLKTLLEQRFRIDRVVASPVAGLGPQLASQVWFVGEKKAGESVRATAIGGS